MTSQGSKRRAAPLAAIVVLVQCLWAAPAMAWTSVGTGIEYRKFTLPDPNNVFVTRMDRHNLQCYIDTSLANGRCDGSVERVSGQFNRYEDALAYWGEDWGYRNDVVAAVNGDYWNTSTYIVLGPQVQSGWVIKTYGSPSIGWTLDRQGIVGYGTWSDARARHANGVTQWINGINVARGSSDLIMYTNQYGAATKTDSTGVEVLVEMARPAMVVPSNDPARGIVRQVRVSLGNTQVPFDHVVLSATGSAATTLQANATVGSTIDIYQNLSNTYQTWLKSYAAVGGLTLLQSPYVYLNEKAAAGEGAALDGDVVPMGGVIAPRTAVAFNKDYVYFVVNDGRSSISLGMDFTQLADFCRYNLGATDAISCDGGGSSAMVVNGTVMNVPSDGSERFVPNGVLMCVRRPKSQSTAFNVGDTVRTTSSTTMRTGPGSNYLSVISLTSNRTGTVLDHSLRGIYAKGANWWRCTIDGNTGWVSQSALTRTAGGNLPTFSQHPVETTVCPTTGTAVFSVNASGTGTLLYQWQRHGVNLTDNGHFLGTATPSLTIVGTNDPDLGSYRCIVTDNIGSATSYSAALFLYKHTVVNVQPQSAYGYMLGGSGIVSFGIQASGEGALSYRWQKGTTNLADDGHYSGTGTPTLTISGIDSRDAGQYRCRVSTTCETTYSEYATLTVVSSDLDGDGDGDLDDFARLQNCLGTIDPKTNAPDCVLSDTNGDGKVETTDVPFFRSCLAGPEIPLPPGC